MPEITHQWPRVYTFFSAIAIWSSVPLTLRLCTTLKRRRTVYFWAILATSWGLCIRAIGYLLGLLVPSSPWALNNALALGGCVPMVTGFSVVLYSRLNLILESQITRRAFLVLIIVTAFVFHPLILTLSFTTHNMLKLAPLAQINSRIEKVQLVIFSVEEIILSYFYVRAAYHYLRSRFVQRGKTRKAMSLLLVVQVIIICIDIALVVMEFAGLVQLKLFLHSFAYSVKLELEFVVLNQLVELSQLGVAGISNGFREVHAVNNKS
jgi:hypothetical protein